MRNRHLGLYALATLMSLVVITQSSHARIIYTPTNVTLSGNGFITLPVSGEVAQFTIQEIVRSEKCSVGEYVEATVNVAPQAAGNGVVGNDEGAGALSLDAPIGPSQNFNQAESLMARWDDGTEGGCGSTYTGYWCDGNNGSPCSDVDAYLGLKVEFKGSTYYGWAHVAMTPGMFGHSIAFSVQLKGYAYETIPGQPIMAGQTAEDGAE
jgi:hypothetical protein